MITNPQLSDDEIIISPVLNCRELMLVGQFRYEVNVREMGLKMAYADHDQQTVIEPLDHTGLVLAAWENKKVVGTLRINFLRKGNVGHYFDLYGLGKYGPEVHSGLSIGTRLAVAPNFRIGRLFRRLTCAAYRYVYLEGGTFTVMDCRKHLVKNFLKLGFYHHCGDILHPEFGEVTVLQLSVRDGERLATARSPFLEIYNSLRP